ncbi:carbonic anhydrase [Salsuginibacillus halophilus]|uniref:carbonic anhydrase n=1 Tax=Salsuginibacillus halophilus TaxID=517424 RepID=A0A2P8HE51_9BACI|nr:carbonic anhydrase [Salsuginibacillus halophilus]PSL44508.1 carbonic anhydrase [Salsuginibacillus halophilus]
MSKQLQAMLEHNRHFVETKAYEPYLTSKLPNKKAVILTCMDARLIELLPKALGLQNGDAKVVKNAGAVVTSLEDSIVRSILVALYELEAEEVYVIGHHGCGMIGMEGSNIVEKAKSRSSTAAQIADTFESEAQAGAWLNGFTTVEENVSDSVQLLRTHPLLPDDTAVHGLVIHPETGAVDVVTEET